MELTRSCEYSIKVLEDAIEQIRSGAAYECVAFLKCTDGSMMFRQSEMENIYAFIGYTEQWKWDILERQRGHGQELL